MKHFIILIIMLYCSPLLAQDTTHQQKPGMSNHELAMEYLEKSKRQKKTGTILGISGGACLTATLVIALVGFSQWANGTSSEGNGLDNAGTALTIAGSALVVTAIPFMLSAKSNKKKADLLLSTENVMPSTFSIPSKKLYSVGVRINF